MKLQFWGCRGSACFSTTPRPPFCCLERGHCAVSSPAARAGPGTPGLCERCPSRAPGRSGCASGSGRAAPRLPVRARGAARGAGSAFPSEGRRRRNALFHPPAPRAMRRRIKPAETGREARGLRGGVFTEGCAAPRALRYTPVPSPAPARPAISGP